MDTANAKVTNVNAAPQAPNGPSAPSAVPQAASAKRVQKRDVPTIGVLPTKEEFADIEAALVKTLGGLNMHVSKGPFVLACALKTIRGEILKK